MCFPIVIMNFQIFYKYRKDETATSMLADYPEMASVSWFFKMLYNNRDITGLALISRRAQGPWLTWWPLPLSLYLYNNISLTHHFDDQISEIFRTELLLGWPTRKLPCDQHVRKYFNTNFCNSQRIIHRRHFFWSSLSPTFDIFFFDIDIHQ